MPLLGVALGHRDALEAVPAAAEWEALFAESRRQSLVAVLFSAVGRLPAAQRPPRGLLLRWMAAARQVVETNRRLAAEVSCVVATLERDGFPVVLLKGCGVARYYPKPELRMCGDIDLWTGAKASEIWAYSRRYGACPRATCLHVDLPLSKCARVEVHYLPSFKYNPFGQARLKRWFAAEAPQQFAHRVRWDRSSMQVAVPTERFDRIYLLLHLYRHFLGEGVGLRHLMDYYYLLSRGVTEEERLSAQADLRRLGLTRFARSVMYVMVNVFGLPEAHCLLTPDAVRGARLLEEVRLTGNFGLSDLRYKHPSAGLGRPARFVRKCRRVFRFFQDDPLEVLSVPFFIMAHFLWRKWKGFV